MRPMPIAILALAAASHAPSHATDLPDRSFLTRSEHALGVTLPADLVEAWQSPTQARGGTYGYDVDHVDLVLAVDFGDQTITATSTLTVTMTEDGRTSIPFDFDDNLTMTGVTVDGAPVLASHVGSTITVPLIPAPDMGTQLDVAISYEGHPQAVGNKSMRFTTHASVPLMYTLSTPYSTSGTTVIPISHYWRPCKDVSDDKSTYSCELTVPDTMTGVSNGLLVGTADNGDGTKTFSWQHDYPVAPYLITIGVTNYVEIQDEYVGPGGSSPVRHYAWPEDLADATSDWSVTVPQLELFAFLFGEYPFIGEKFGNYETTSGPAVEHQTAVSTPNTVVNGLGTYDWLNAHEMAHMWWGDCLTVSDWAHVWLSEGSASYAEALWRESMGGASALHAYMAAVDNGPYAGTVVNPSYVWNAIVYDKGSWILHMLRHILGDSAFLQMLMDYRAAHEYGNVVTDDLQAAVATAYGGDVSWFFDTWVYQEGRPDYLFDWTSTPALTGGATLELSVEQAQSMDYPTYTMPIDVRITTASGTEFVVITNTERVEVFSIPVSDEVLSVELDPDHWILADFTEIVVGVDAPQVTPPTFLAPSAPNPFHASTSVRFGLSRDSRVALRVFDASGRLVRTLARGVLGAGEHRVAWDGRDEDGRAVGAGTYFTRLVGPDGVLERRIVLIR